MTLPSLAEQQQREHEAFTLAEKILFERHIKPRVSSEIIAEHKENPVGHHSDDLERVLIYLRKHHGQMAGKYILVCTVPHEEWRVAQITGVRKQPPVLLDQKYPNRFQAEHGIFLLRLQDAGLIEGVES